MRTDHNVIGETHSLLTPLSVRLRGQLTEVLPAQTTAARSETETAWVGRLCADPLRPGCAKARNGCGPRDFFNIQKERIKAKRVLLPFLVGVSFCEYDIYLDSFSVFPVGVACSSPRL
jgi:hypothetical protein